MARHRTHALTVHPRIPPLLHTTDKPVFSDEATLETHVGTHERNSGQQTEIKHRLDRGNIGNLQEKHKHIKNRVEANGKTQRKGTAQTKQQANKNTVLKGKAPAIPARGPVYSLTWYRPSTNTQAATRQLFKPHPSAAMDGTISM